MRHAWRNGAVLSLLAGLTLTAIPAWAVEALDRNQPDPAPVGRKAVVSIYVVDGASSSHVSTQEWDLDHDRRG